MGRFHVDTAFHYGKGNGAWQAILLWYTAHYIHQLNFILWRIVNNY